MNKDRRKQLAELIEKLGPLEDLLSEIKETAEAIRDEEQEYYDNMPEGLQMSDRGQAAEQAIENIDYVVQGIDDIDVSGFIGFLEEAQA